MRPGAAHDALALAGVPATDLRVRALGLGEVVLGALVIVAGGMSGFALAAVYAAFAVLVMRERRSGTSCGCFGTADVPVTALHAVVDGIVAVAAVVTGLAAAPGLVVVARAEGPLVLAVVATAVLGVRMLLVDLPRLVDRMSLLEEVAP